MRVDTWYRDCAGAKWAGTISWVTRHKYTPIEIHIYTPGRRGELFPTKHMEFTTEWRSTFFGCLHGRVYAGSSLRPVFTAQLLSRNARHRQQSLVFVYIELCYTTADDWRHNRIDSAYAGLFAFWPNSQLLLVLQRLLIQLHQLPHGKIEHDILTAAGDPRAHDIAIDLLHKLTLASSRLQITHESATNHLKMMKRTASPREGEANLSTSNENEKDKKKRRKRNSHIHSRQTPAPPSAHTHSTPTRPAL